MIRGVLSIRFTRQVAFGRARAVAHARQSPLTSTSASSLQGHAHLDSTSPVWRHFARRGLAQAAANDNKEEKREESKEEKVEKDSQEKAEEKTEEKAQDKAEEKATEKAEDKVEEKVPEDLDARLRRDVADMQEQVKQKRHKLLLALADFENDKKKLAKERDVRHRRAVVGFAERMVDVYGKFDTKFPADAKTSGDAQASLQEGIHLVRQAFGSLLGRFDVNQMTIKPGEQFVVAQHESVGTVVGSEHADGTVADLVKPGWIFQPRKGPAAVLARTQVKVAKK